MKKLLFVTLLLSSALVLLQSCQREVGFEQESNNPVTGDFRAKIEGQQWVATKAAGGYRMNGLINLTGLGNDKRHLTITLDDRGVGTYILNDTSMSAAAYIDSTLTDPINFTTNQGVNPGDAGGTLTITSIDEANKRISGTFSFKVFRQMDGLQRTLTEGSFTNIKYETSLSPGSATDSMRVKISGTMWNPPIIHGLLVTVPGQPSQISVVGSDNQGIKTVGLIFPANITPGNYTLDFFGLTYIGQYNPDDDPMHSQAAVSGTLTILEHNTSTKRIRGNFNFRAEEIINPAAFTNLTEGYFSVKYQ